MVFSSSVFLFVFLPIVLIVYSIVPVKLQNVWLLFSSLFFYLWGGTQFFPIIIFSILINYIGGMCLASTQKESRKKLILAVFVGLNIVNLGYWKYTNFLIDIIRQITNFNIEMEDILLPIGISFYTFQGVSYIIDVYRKDVEVQKNPIYVALYICLFPQLIAGPIVRYSDIANEIKKRERILDNYEQGIIRFIIGLSKKVIIANNMGAIAEPIFQATPNENTVAIAWIGAIAYSLQIYFDFSGYSDMAIGIGRIFGFSFPENFNYPYVAKSITEFWRRWHISLSSWFRDYVYIPLGGNRRGNVYVNLFLVFLLTGIWHGANWTFVIWGIYYGIFIVIERWGKKTYNIHIPDVISHIYTLLIVVLGWVIFNAGNLEHAWQYILSMFGLLTLGKIRFTYEWYLNNYSLFLFFTSIIAALPVGKTIWKKIEKKLPELVQKILCYMGTGVLLLICMIYVMTSTYNPFIYFQF